MRNNSLFLLTVLLVLVGFFSSTTLTGSFSREVHTGVLNYGSIESLGPYNNRGPTTLTGILATASQSRMFAIFQDYKEQILSNVEREVTTDFCRDLELQLGKHYENRNSRVPDIRFNQPELAAYKQYDLTGDGLLSVTDKDLCRVIARGQNQDSRRRREVSVWNCPEEDLGKTTCRNGKVSICTLDQYGTPTFADIPIPPHLNPKYTRCNPGKPINQGNQGLRVEREPAFYTDTRVSTTLYQVA